MAVEHNFNDGSLDLVQGAVQNCSMRYHELALQLWLNSRFQVADGYPVPVVFAKPMDAFSHFKNLWKDPGNPFSYLFSLKDQTGKPVYEPHPSPVRYPLISVNRKSFKYRTAQNFSIHRFRNLNWPTVSDVGDPASGHANVGTNITRRDLGNVTTCRMPSAWDFRYQIDYFCLRPDTQAKFISQLMEEFWRTGGIPQTWIVVDYPGWGKKHIRLYLEGDIEDATPDEPAEGGNTEFRTSLSVTVEGWNVDINHKVHPALWKLVFGQASVSPSLLSTAMSAAYTADLRDDDQNTAMSKRENVPPRSDTVYASSSGPVNIQETNSSTFFGGFSITS